MTQASAVTVDTHADGDRIVLTVFDAAGEGVSAALDAPTALAVARDIIQRLDATLHPDTDDIQIVVKDI